MDPADYLAQGEDPTEVGGNLESDHEGNHGREHADDHRDDHGGYPTEDPTASNKHSKLISEEYS